MATTSFWVANAAATAMVQTITVTGVSTGGVLSATLNGKTISYTCLVTDTTSTAAAAWQALLASSVAPAEFQEVGFSVNTNIITATAAVAGTPFSGVTGPGLSFSGTGGATVTVATTQANSSPSDVANPLNWNRNNIAALPQNGDDVVIANSSVPLLWNCDALQAVQFNSFTRWQTFTGTIGLPVLNPLGYVEWRQTYFRFSGNGLGALPVVLGQGLQGSGPGRERYNVGNQQVKVSVLNAGSALDNYAVCFLGTHAANAYTLLNTSLGIAMYTAEVSSLASVKVDGSGSLALGQGVTFGATTGLGPNSSSSSVPGSTSGIITVVTGSAVLYCAPQTINVQNGSQLVVQSIGLTYGTVQAQGGSVVTWLSDSSIANLILQTNSIFDKSQDVRPIVITNSTQDGDTTQVLDPNNCITWTNNVTLTNAVSGSPFTFGPGRQVRII